MRENAVSWSLMAWSRRRKWGLGVLLVLAVLLPLSMWRLGRHWPSFAAMRLGDFARNSHTDVQNGDTPDPQRALVAKGASGSETWNGQPQSPRSVSLSDLNDHATEYRKYGFQPLTLRGEITGWYDIKGQHDFLGRQLGVSVRSGKLLVPADEQNGCGIYFAPSWRRVLETAIGKAPPR
jgi:hypothetical protein